MGLWKSGDRIPPQSMFDRIVAVEAKLVQQAEIIKLIRKYVETDIASPWKESAENLVAAIRRFEGDNDAG
jgi:hypothetical protein